MISCGCTCVLIYFSDVVLATAGRKQLWWLVIWGGGGGGGGWGLGTVVGKERRIDY